jgi:hypothetical protein
VKILGRGSILAAFGCLRREKAGVFLIQFKQKRDAFGFGIEIGFTVGGIHGAIKRLVGFEQNRRRPSMAVPIGAQGSLIVAFAGLLAYFTIFISFA